jgi:hypothetical protein
LSDQVRVDVRQLRLVELLYVAELLHLRRQPVGHDVEVAAAGVAPGVDLADLAEELVVVVDLLGVLDLGAELLLELVERGRLLLVDVERPVREVELVGDLTLGDHLDVGGLVAAAALDPVITSASRQQRREAESGHSRTGLAKQAAA